MAYSKTWVAVGTSFISYEQAGLNLRNEIPGWDFEKVRSEADAAASITQLQKNLGQLGALAAIALAGIMGSLIDGPMFAILQSAVAPEMQGRVITVFMSSRARPCAGRAARNEQ